MYLPIDARSHTPIWEQIVQQMKERILIGVLQPGEKLLSVRELSAALAVNPNTVSKAYQELERQGIIETRRGKGTFVSETMPETGNESKRTDIQKELRLLIMEASYAGVDRGTFIGWIDQYWTELGGGTHTDRKESLENYQ